MVFLCGAGPATETITRAEMIDAALASIRFLVPCGEQPPEAERASVVMMLSEYARSVESLPAEVRGLPPGSKASFLYDTLSLTSTDPEYCKARMRFHLMAIVAQAHCARYIRLLSDPEERVFLERVDDVLRAVANSLESRWGTFLSRSDIEAQAARVRDDIVSKMRSPVLVCFKHIPTPNEVASIVEDFDRRLPGAMESAHIRARHLSARESPDYEERYRYLRESLLHETFQHAVRGLARVASLTDAEIAPLRGDRVYPDYVDVARRAASLQERELQKAEPRRTLDKNRKTAQSEEQPPDLESLRQDIHDPLTLPERRADFRIELPRSASRPTTQPTATRGADFGARAR